MKDTTGKHKLSPVCKQTQVSCLITTNCFNKKKKLYFLKKLSYELLLVQRLTISPERTHCVTVFVRHWCTEVCIQRRTNGQLDYNLQESEDSAVHTLHGPRMKSLTTRPAVIIIQFTLNKQCVCFCFLFFSCTGSICWCSEHP